MKSAPLSLKAAPVIVLMSLITASCAGASADYPSFIIPASDTATGRVSVQFPGVATPEPTDPSSALEPLPTDLSAQIAAIRARATQAANAFSRDAGSTLSLARDAYGTDVTSKAWAEAQLSFADLTTHHSEGQLALADLDRLSANTEVLLVDPAIESAISDAQSGIAAQLMQQSKTLSTIAVQLER